MTRYDYGIDNNNKTPNRKKAVIGFKLYHRFITMIALPALFLILTLIVAPISSVQATGDGGNETAATPAPGGASLGPAANGTNATTTGVTQSACLPQNATTTTDSPTAVGANATTTTDNTTAIVAPSGGGIAPNNTSTSLDTAGNTTRAIVAPSGGGIAPNNTSIC
jgi:hypothetical protein